MPTKRKLSDFVQLKIRMPEALRVQLEEDAERRGGSINSEVVRRLERSFDRSGLLDEVLDLTYGDQLAAFLRALGLVMEAAGTRGSVAISGDWLEDHSSWRAAREAAKMLLDLWDPPAESDGEREDAAQSLAGVKAVDSFIDVMRKGGEPDRKGSVAARRNRLVGPIANAMIEEWPRMKKRIESGRRGDQVDRWEAEAKVAAGKAATKRRS